MKKYYLLLFLCLGVIWNGLSQSDTNSVSGADTTLNNSSSQSKLIAKIKKGINEVSDHELFSHSLQVRWQGKNKQVKKQYKTKPTLKIGIGLYTNLEVDAFWANALTGKWVYTAKGKVRFPKRKDIKSGDATYTLPDSLDQATYFVNFNFIQDTIDSKNNVVYSIESSASTNQPLRTNFPASKINVISNKVNIILDGAFKGKVYQKPSQAPVDSVIEQIQFLLDELGDKYWDELYEKTKGIRASKGQHDIDRLAEELDKLIELNKNISGDLPDIFDGNEAYKCVYNDSVLRIISWYIDKSFQQANLYLDEQQYLLAFPSYYNYQPEELNWLANQVIQNSTQAKGKNITLYVLQEVRDSLNHKEWHSLGYSFTDKESGLKKVVDNAFKSKVIFEKQDEETEFYSTFQNLICSIDDYLTLNAPPSKNFISKKLCNGLQDKVISGVTKLINKDKIIPVPEFSIVQKNEAFATPSGDIIIPNIKIHDVEYDWERGYVNSFKENGVQYESIIWKYENASSPPIGFICYMQEGKWKELENEVKNEYVGSSNRSKIECWWADTSKYSIFVYRNFTHAHQGNIIKQPVLDDSSCNIVLCKWNIDRTYTSILSNHNEKLYGTSFKLYSQSLDGMVKPKDIPIDTIQFYRHLPSNECRYYKEIKNVTFGTYFIKKHFDVRLPIKEQDAIFKIGQLYDSLGRAYINDYVESKNNNEFYKFFSSISPYASKERDKASLFENPNSPTNYQDFYARLKNLVAEHQYIVQEIQKGGHDYNNASTLSFYLTDEELKNLTLEQRLKLFKPLCTNTYLWSVNNCPIVRVVTSTKNSEKQAFIDYLFKTQVNDKSTYLEFLFANLNNHISYNFTTFIDWLVDGNLKLEYRKFLMVEICKYSMWGWMKNEESQAITILKTTPLKDIDAFHLFLMNQPIVEKDNKSILDILDNDFDSVWDTDNYNDFIRALIFQSLSRLEKSKDQIADIIANFGAPGYVVYWGGKGDIQPKSSFDSKFNYVNKNGVNQLKLEINVNYEKFSFLDAMLEDGFDQVSSKTYSDSIIKVYEKFKDATFVKDPLFDFVGLVVLDNKATYARGFPAVVPAIVIRYLHNVKLTKTIQYAIQVCVEVVATIVSVGTLAVGSSTLRCAIAIIEIISTSMGWINDILAELDLIDAKLAEDIRKVKFLFDLGTLSIESPLIVKELPKLARSIISGVGKIATNSYKLSAKQLKLLKNFAAELKAKMTLNGLSVAEVNSLDDIDFAFRYAKDNLVNYFKAHSNAYTLIPSDPELLNLIKEFSLAAKNKGIKKVKTVIEKFPTRLKKLHDNFPNQVSHLVAEVLLGPLDDVLKRVPISFKENSNFKSLSLSQKRGFLTDFINDADRLNFYMQNPSKIKTWVFLEKHTQLRRDVDVVREVSNFMDNQQDFIQANPNKLSNIISNLTKVKTRCKTCLTGNNNGIPMMDVIIENMNWALTRFKNSKVNIHQLLTEMAAQRGINIWKADGGAYILNTLRTKSNSYLNTITHFEYKYLFKEGFEADVALTVKGQGIKLEEYKSYSVSAWNSFGSKESNVKQLKAYFRSGDDFEYFGNIMKLREVDNPSVFVKKQFQKIFQDESICKEIYNSNKAYFNKFGIKSNKRLYELATKELLIKHPVFDFIKVL